MKAPSGKALAEPVGVEVLNVGLGGHTGDGQGPIPINYRIRNEGPARKVWLHLVESPVGDRPDKGPGPALPFMVRNGLVPLDVDLPADGTVEGRWMVLSSARYTGSMDGIPWGVRLVAKDAEGRIAGMAPLPDLEYGDAIAVLARTAEDSRVIVQAIEWGGSGSVVEKYALLGAVSMIGWMPDAWYELRPAATIVIARPWADFGPAAVAAISRWLSMGGRLVLVPCACPDWKDAPWTGIGVEPGDLLAAGSGSVHIAEAGACSDEKALFGWMFGRGLVTWNYSGSTDSLAYASGHLETRNPTPSTLVLFLFVVAIILLIGPVVHLTLMRLKRREWAWIAVPAASIVLAVGMYFLATGVKGRDVIAEVNHVVRFHAGQPEGMVLTSVRVVSPDDRSMDLSLDGVDPMTTSGSWSFDSHGGVMNNPPLREVRGGHLSIRGVGMYRWSLEDFHFVSIVPGPSPRIELSIEGKGLEVRNASGMRLADVFIKNESGWFALGKSLGPGEALGVPDAMAGKEGGKVMPAWWTSGDAERLGRYLESAASWATGSLKDHLALVAACEGIDTPEVGIRPAVDEWRGRKTCVWDLVLSDKIEGGGGP